MLRNPLRGSRPTSCESGSSRELLILWEGL